MNLVLAICLQHLRRYPRRRFFYVARVGFVAVVGGSLLGIILVASPYSSAALGLTCFSTIAMLLLIVACLLTPASLAPTVAEEKEDRTLESLFLTDARPWEILIGKITSALLPILLVILAGVPLLLIAAGMGGIWVDQIWRGLALIGTVAFAGAGLGIFISTLSTNPRKAVLLAMAGSLLLFGLLPPLAALVMTGALFGSAELEAATWNLLSPFVALNNILEAKPGAGLTNMAFNLLFGLAVLLAAFLLLPRLALRETTAARSGGRFRFRLKGNPMIWKEMLALPGARRRWRYFLLSYAAFAVLTVLTLFVFDSHLDPEMMLGAITMFSAGAYVLAVLMACAMAFGRERRERSWELLVTSPAREPAIILSRLWAPIRLYSPWLLVAALSGCVFMWAWIEGAYANERLWWAGLGTVGYLTAIPAAGAMALYFSLRFGQGVALALTTLFCLPWPFLCFVYSLDSGSGFFIVCNVILFNVATAKLSNRLNLITIGDKPW
jgi:ABC-type transport system involved in multi-copper enzyme maturation permease subunit